LLRVVLVASGRSDTQEERFCFVVEAKPWSASTSYTAIGARLRARLKARLGERLTQREVAMGR
jgi:hypothetical protein